MANPWIEFDQNYPFEMTQGNHLHYKFFGPYTGYHPDNSIVTFLGNLSKPVLSGFEEAQLAAREIASKFPQPLWLWLSGGVDSEAMALAFLAAKVPIRIVIARYNGGLNDYDIQWALDFCRTRDLNFELLDVDLDDFYESGRHGHIADLYRCRSPQFSLHFEMMSKFDGTNLMPWQPPRAIAGANKRITLGFPEDHYFSYARFLAAEKTPGVPFFFLYTPELIASFLRTRALKEILDSNGRAFSEYALKVRMYQEAGFKVVPRPAKWTGFEEVKKHFAERYQSDTTVFDRLYRNPYDFKYPLPQTAICGIPKLYF